jgi:hypothetical protein
MRTVLGYSLLSVVDFVREAFDDRYSFVLDGRDVLRVYSWDYHLPVTEYLSLVSN